MPAVLLVKLIGVTGSIVRDADVQGAAVWGDGEAGGAPDPVGTSVITPRRSGTLTNPRASIGPR